MSDKSLRLSTKRGIDIKQTDMLSFKEDNRYRCDSNKPLSHYHQNHDTHVSVGRVITLHAVEIDEVGLLMTKVVAPWRRYRPQRASPKVLIVSFIGLVIRFSM